MRFVGGVRPHLEEAVICTTMETKTGMMLERIAARVLTTRVLDKRVSATCTAFVKCSRVTRRSKARSRSM